MSTPPNSWDADAGSPRRKRGRPPGRRTIHPPPVIDHITPSEPAVSLPLLPPPRSYVSTGSTKDLPFEILSDVFRVGLAMAEVDGKRELFLSRIISVCQSWRQVACSTALLWNRIHWELPEDYQGPCTQMMLQAEHYLKRSSTTLIDVTVVFPYLHVVDPELVRDLFHPHLRRCRRLRLVAQRSESMSFFLPLPDTMANLEALEIVGGDLTDLITPPPLLVFSKGVPGALSLRSLSIAGVGVYDLTNLAAPTAHLERVDLDLQCALGEWFQAGGILGPDSMLTTLTLRNIHALFIPLDIPLLTLKHVTSLRIGKTIEPVLLRRLACPNLKHLELVGRMFGTEHVFPCVYAPTGVELSSLAITVGSDDIWACDIAEIFVAQASITELSLELKGCMVPLEVLQDPFKKPLAFRSDYQSSAPLLPSLRTIHLFNKTNPGGLDLITTYSLALLQNIMLQRPNLVVVVEEGIFQVKSSCYSDERIARMAEEYAGRFFVARQGFEPRA